MSRERTKARDGEQAQGRSAHRLVAMVVGAGIVLSSFIFVIATQGKVHQRHGIGAWVVPFGGYTEHMAMIERRAIIQVDDAWSAFQFVAWDRDIDYKDEYDAIDWMSLHHYVVLLMRVEKPAGFWAPTSWRSGHEIWINNETGFGFRDIVDDNRDPMIREIRDRFLRHIDAEDGTSMARVNELIDAGRFEHSRVIWWGWVLNAITIFGAALVAQGIPEVIRRLRALVGRVSAEAAELPELSAQPPE